MRWPERVLFVGAHCDDVELLAGGALHALVRSGRDVGVMVFSDHRGVVNDAKAALARQELEVNLRWLEERSGRSIVRHLPDALGGWMPACQGDFQRERGRIYAAMEALRDRYQAVVTHPQSDTNQDHLQVAQEAIRVFKGHASVLGGEFPANDVGRFQAQVFLPLSQQDVEAKVSMISTYESQKFDGRPYFDPETIRGLARVRGSQIRSQWAEAFCVLARVHSQL